MSVHQADRGDGPRPAGETLVTARLRLRRWRAEDEVPMAAINRDPEVTRYLNRPSDELAVAAFHGMVVAHWERHGFGVYAVEGRTGELAGRLLGFTGVAHPTFLPALAHRPELGWRLAREAWGQGLATEAATAVRAQAFRAWAMTDLISIIHPENDRSRRVGEKLGMTVECWVHNPVLRREVEVWSLGRAGPGVRQPSSRVVDLPTAGAAQQAEGRMLT